jgi:translation initiation factor IF-3
MAHKELGAAMLKKVETDLAEEITVEQYPRMEGRQMVMMISSRKH